MLQRAFRRIEEAIRNPNKVFAYLCRAYLVQAWRIRQWWYLDVRKRLRVHASADAFAGTIPHNIAAIRVRLDRMLHLIKPLRAIETIKASPQILVIGPRNEWDLYLLQSEGFDIRRVRAIDLISVSPRIDCGDMHDMGALYADSMFDVVLCGWALAYSANPGKAAAEMIRVVKPHGIIGVAVEYYQRSTSGDDEWLDGYVSDEREKQTLDLGSTQALVALYDNVGRIYWQHDAPLKLSHRPGALIASPSTVSVIFEVVK